MKQTGFTLVELMVVILIIGILASTAIPTQMNKINKARIEASNEFIDVAIEGIEQVYKKTGSFPKNNKEAGIPSKEKFVGKFVTSLEVIDGAIHLTFGNDMSKEYQGALLTVRPAIVKGEPRIPISWFYGYARAPKELTLIGENKTTFPPETLPFEYR